MEKSYPLYEKRESIVRKRGGGDKIAKKGSEKTAETTGCTGKPLCGAKRERGRRVKTFPSKMTISLVEKKMQEASSRQQKGGEGR